MGAHVPPWNVVPIPMFEDLLRETGLAEIWRAKMDGLRGIDWRSPVGLHQVQEVAQCLGQRLRAQEMPAKVRVALGRTLPRLGPGSYAVRSSLFGEDSPHQSLAGHFESFLMLSNEMEVADALMRCWASAFHVAVLLQQLREGCIELPRMGVIIQHMVLGDVSGVVFTAHPVTRRLDQVVVTANWGLCEGVVSGRCNTDEFVLSDGQEVSTRIADKDRMVIASDGGVRTVEVLSSKRGQPCLHRDEVANIAREALRIANAHGLPQDIEWTMTGKQLHILQARPITSLGVNPEPKNIATRAIY